MSEKVARALGDDLVSLQELSAVLFDREKPFAHLYQVKDLGLVRRTVRRLIQHFLELFGRFQSRGGLRQLLGRVVQVQDLGTTEEVLTVKRGDANRHGRQLLKRLIQSVVA